MAKEVEKSALDSKKFKASMIWSLLWLVLIGYGIAAKIDSEVLLAMVYINGVVQGLYLGGQAAVDSIVRAAVHKGKVALSSTKEESLNDDS
jgi:hypothetical protein